MLGWLWRIIVGRFRVCDHVWRTDATVKIMESASDTLPIHRDKLLNCTKCGDWKKVRL